MQDVNKPKFWNIVSSIIGLIISFSTTVIGTFNFPEDFSNLKRFFLILGIFAGSYIIVLLLYNVAYSLLLFKYCKKIEVNNIALINLTSERLQEIKNLERYIKESNKTLEHIVDSIRQGACDISFEEKQYLNNLYEISRKDIGYLYNIKGDEKNE